jgi:hypothetical protein
MRWITRKILGLAFEPGGVLAAEIRVRAGAAEFSAAGDFRYPEGTGLDQPDRLGEALREFLAGRDFSAKDAVLGLPARWLVAKQKRVPPVGGADLTSMLRLQGEKEFSVPSDQIVLDYADAGSSGSSRDLLLVAAQRAKVKQATAMARAAGLKVEAVVPSVMPLAAGRDGAQPGTRCTLYVRPCGAEIIVVDEGRIEVLKHLRVSSQESEDVGHLAAVVGRLLGLLPARRSGEEEIHLTVWDATGLGAGRPQRLIESVNVHAGAVGDISELGVATELAGSGQEIRLYAAPTMLALSGAREQLRPVDFIHSKLAVRASRIPGKPVLWAGAITVTILLIIGLLVEGWHSDRREAVGLRNRLEAMQPEIERAHALLQKVSEAGEWFGGNRKYLDGLRELTLSFPEQGTVWATSVVVQKDMRSIVSGKSVDEQNVLEVLDRMKDNERFAGPKLLHMRQTRSGAGEVSFAISLDFADQE